MKRTLLLCFLTLTTTLQANAQRGKDFIEQSSVTQTPLSSFPGYFDTGMAPKNKFVLDLPLTSFDYGVTDNFTIGTNAFAATFTTLTFQPFLFLKARYRFYSSGKISSVITGYGGYFYIPGQGENRDTSAWVYGGTNNTSYFIDSNNILNFHITALSLSLKTGEQTDTKYFKLSLNTIALGVGYQTFFTERFGIEGQILYSPYFNLTYEDPSNQSSLKFNNNYDSLPYFLRLLVNYKTGKESNLSAGIWSLSSLAYGPWLGWQVIF